MNKIINTKEATEIAEKLRSKGKTIVLAGGVFDILHLGHILFLEKAKKFGDFLFVLLESDQNAKKKKGVNRPIHTQKDRAFVLSSLQTVDYVVKLPKMTNDKEYDRLIAQLNPAVIAATKKDRESKHKERQAKAIGIKLAYVTERITNQSTTRMEKLINNQKPAA